MEKIYVEKLKALMDQNGISYCIAADLNEGAMDTLGDAARLEHKDLVDQLFGTMEQIRSLDDSLAGQQLPRSWKQGKVKCLVCKPSDRIIVAFFYNESRSFADSIDLCNELTIKIDGIWG